MINNVHQFGIESDEFNYQFQSHETALKGNGEQTLSTRAVFLNPIRDDRFPLEIVLIEFFRLDLEIRKSFHIVPCTL